MKDENNLVNKHEYTSFLKNALAIQGSVTPKVFTNVFLLLVYACCISWLYNFVPSIALPIGPFEYAGLMMGLILVFRVNAGYDRWWEARKLWGNVVNQCRNLTIIVCNYTKGTDTVWKINITNYIAAMPYLMKNHLRGDNTLDPIQHLINTPLLNKLNASTYKLNILSTYIAQELHDTRNRDAMDSFTFLQAESTRAILLDCQGACERISTTPMPFVMAVKSRSFIFLFLLALPFALVDISIVISPIISGLVAYALFSLDQIGIELQNPFSEKSLSHLPLNDICRKIEQNIVEIRSCNA